MNVKAFDVAFDDEWEAGCLLLARPSCEHALLPQCEPSAVSPQGEPTSSASGACDVVAYEAVGRTYWSQVEKSLVM